MKGVWVDVFGHDQNLGKDDIKLFCLNFFGGGGWKV